MKKSEIIKKELLEIDLEHFTDDLIIMLENNHYDARNPRFYTMFHNFLMIQELEDGDIVEGYGDKIELLSLSDVTTFKSWIITDVKKQLEYHTSVGSYATINKVAKELDFYKDVNNLLIKKLKGVSTNEIYQKNIDKLEKRLNLK